MKLSSSFLPLLFPGGQAAFSFLFLLLEHFKSSSSCLLSSSHMHILYIYIYESSHIVIYIIIRVGTVSYTEACLHAFFHASFT